MDNHDDITLWKWLDGEDFSTRKINKVLRASQALEADNERITVQLIRKRKLPINIKNYIKEANAYIMFHDVILRRRSFDGNYNMPEIMNRMNSKKVLDYKDLKIAPKWFHNVFD